MEIIYKITKIYINIKKKKFFKNNIHRKIIENKQNYFIKIIFFLK